MQAIKRQIRQARWRLNLVLLLSILSWTLFATLILGAIGVAAAKLVPLPESVDPETWFWSCFIGSIALGLVVGFCLLYFRRRSGIDAALELDRRCGLKERISSSWVLSDQERASAMGRALERDATARLAEVDVVEEFRIRPRRQFALPLIPAAAMVALALLNNPVREQPANQAAVLTQSKPSAANELLQRKLAERIQIAKANGLEEAARALAQIQENQNQREASSQHPKDALIKLNDLADALQKKREALGSSEKIKEHLSQLKEIDNGPADKAARALQAGDFNKAGEALQQLRDKLAKNELTQEERKQLAEQLAQMQKKIEETIQMQRQAKEDLAQQIKQSLQAGDRQKAAELQQKLDDLKQADEQAKLQQLADKLGRAVQQAKDGDSQQAARQLDQLADKMQQMQQEMDNLRMVDDMLDAVAQAKDALRGDGAEGDDLNVGDVGRSRQKSAQLPLILLLRVRVELRNFLGRRGDLLFSDVAIGNRRAELLVDPRHQRPAGFVPGIELDLRVDRFLQPDICCCDLFAKHAPHNALAIGLFICRGERWDGDPQQNTQHAQTLVHLASPEEQVESHYTGS